MDSCTGAIWQTQRTRQADAERRRAGGPPLPCEIRTYLTYRGLGRARLPTMLRGGAGVGRDLASRASADRRIRKLSLDSTPGRTSGATLRSPRQRPRSSQPSVGQDTRLAVQVREAEVEAGRNHSRFLLQPQERVLTLVAKEPCH